MASSSRSPFALRPLPLPQSDRKPTSLADFISRVNADKGGFRNVTEESLRQELEAEAEANDVVESKEVDMLNGESEVDGDAEQISVEDFHEAVNEVRRNAEYDPYPNAMLTVDFISLMLSKEMPSQAGATVSPALRDLVGLGTLGADKLATSNIDDARLRDNKLVATGCKFADIDRTVESVLTSASRLQKEISVETKYWAEVLAVSDKGWSVTRVPNEPETLGVRYGFSEAAPDFRNTSLAPMRRGDDGTVELDCGRMLGDPQRLLVTLEKNGRIVGQSALARPLPQDAPLEDRVLEARNTIFAQELWHEINREGRLLQTYGVRLEDSAVSYSINDDLRVVFALQPLERLVEEGASESLPEDSRAESLAAALHQLLTYAHRINNQKRTRPMPKNRLQSTTTPPYPLLRPVLTNLQHETLTQDVTRFISDLTTVLQSAGVTTALFRLHEPPISLNLAETHGSPSEGLIQALFGPLELQYEMNITPEARLLIHCKSVMSNAIATTYHIYLLPPAQGELNPLQFAYPPVHVHGEGYSLPELKYYIQQAVARALTERASKTLATITPSSPQREDGLQAQWVKHVSGIALENDNDPKERLSFDVVYAKPGTSGVHPELRVHGSWAAAGQQMAATRTWAWTVDDAAQGVQKESVDQVVRDVVARMVQPLA
ncbi:Mediator of RNA polymerase II transcription subunit 17 [Cytospora mali]|uniref:Mediator of RNA polymerase II transcription subunit 17 n=1 Tax=Cytospora mali TaxID=578113 RepID=A0A194V138_CYTMA|nr:Mediator of RNA polymerase II transcription subunit 17 [Valsa mali var. pyri (nom. inval.)]